ncbi:uncharacterized protein PRCAT00002395001 [Priceomyces carsonii]|uniref:uncharacterized protein n=1 Tax=Priceomyces carsonii TaxID=28549 RepID=UPI002EDA66FB|nr:unnamed protein product [Priceomyces carsonii]
MTIYSFYIFDKHCNCVYSREYSHKENDQGLVNKNNESDTSKLLFGILYSLKNISSKLGNAEIGNNLKSFSTARFRIHYLESASGLKFVLVSDNGVDNLQNVLWELYSNYYLNNIVFNALSPVDFQFDERISNSNFIRETDEFLESLKAFS